jgi:hypothetical protein
MSIMGEEVTNDEVALHYYVTQFLGHVVSVMANMEEKILGAEKVCAHMEVNDHNRAMVKLITKLFGCTLALIAVHKEIVKVADEVAKGIRNENGETIQ